MLSTVLLAFVPQLSPAPAQEASPYQRRITPEVKVVRSVAPSVVFISTEGRATVRTIFGDRTRKVAGSGSGVVLHEDGYIVTNFHVIKDGTDSISVTFDPTYGDEREYTARVISYEPSADLALLKIESEQPFPRARLGSSSDLMIGERVLAIGNPYGQTHTVSTGIISGLHREVAVDNLTFTELIQTDAAINPGNSGGPLVNINGEVIGINTVVNRMAENIGFAIPVDEVRRVLEDRLLSPSLARAWLGFEVDLGSLEVSEVVGGGPADLAGMRPGDRVLSIGGEPVTNEPEYRFARVELAPDRETSIVVERAGERVELAMEGWGRVRGLLFDRLGIEVEEVLVQAGLYSRRHLRVTSVRADGPAEKLGLRTGDILNSVTPVGGSAMAPSRPADLALLVSRLEPGDALAIDMWRDANEDGWPFERTDEYSELYQGTMTLQ